MKQIELLYRLQEIENRMEMGNQNIKDLESPRKINKEIEEHKKIKACIESNSRYIDEYNKKLKIIESDLKDLEVKSTELKEKMYGGKINDLKQLGIMLKEQEKFENKSQELNKEMEEKLEQLEALESETEGLRNKDKEMYIAIKKMLKERTESKNQGEIELKKLLTEKEKVVILINPENLEAYNYIKSKKNNPVAVLEVDICSGCHMDLPIMTISKLQRDELVTCSNCGRILYKL